MRGGRKAGSTGQRNGREHLDERASVHVGPGVGVSISTPGLSRFLGPCLTSERIGLSRRPDQHGRGRGYPTR